MITPTRLSYRLSIERRLSAKKRARENLAAARLCATPIGELQARYSGGMCLRQQATPELDDGPGPLASQASQASTQLSSVDEDDQPDVSDEEEDSGREIAPVRGERRLGPVAACREHSTSVWLHFPHVELLVLFFAFEGAVASFASAMRHSECAEVFYTAVGAVVSATIVPPQPHQPQVG